MKRYHKVTWSVLLAAALALTGCGEVPIELTREEQQTIAQYAAHVVSKYNVKQREGIVSIEPQEETETEVPDTVPAQETETDTQTSADGQGGEASAQDEQQGSLTQILGLQGVTVSYTGAELAASWEEGGYASLTPTEGHQYLALHFTLNNPGTEDAGCDILSTGSIFQVSWNGGQKIPAQTTILLDDLSTYQGTVPAGGSAEALLLFEVPLSGGDSVESIALQVIRDEVRWNVEL